MSTAATVDVGGVARNRVDGRLKRSGAATNAIDGYLRLIPGPLLLRSNQGSGVIVCCSLTFVFLLCVLGG